MVDFRVSVVLPAAGSGTRMGMDIPKQFVEIFGRPLISYTIEAFESIPWIENVAIAGPTEDNMKRILKNIILEHNHKKVIITTGGSTRHRSIFNGVQCLNTAVRKPDVVVIHDAVRLFVKEPLLKEIVLAASKHGACGVVIPLVSTVLARNEHGFLDHSLDRSKYIGSEMPQAFQYDVIFNAYQKCTESEFDYGTECLQLALKYSQTQAFLVDGPDYLWKVTHKKDIFAFKGIMKEQFRKLVKLKGQTTEPELSNLTKEKFTAKGVKVVDEDLSKTFKSNILVNFGMDTNVDVNRITTEIALDINCIERNGIFVIFYGGTLESRSDFKGTIQNFARVGSENGITCCAVCCESFVKNERKREWETMNKIAEMIVNVSLETPPFLSGQIFTVLDSP